MSGTHENEQNAEAIAQAVLSGLDEIAFRYIATETRNEMHQEVDALLRKYGLIP